MTIILDTLLKSTYKFLLKMNDLHEVQKEMIKFIKSLQNIYPQDIKKAFIKLHSKLKTLKMTHMRVELSCI